MFNFNQYGFNPMQMLNMMARQNPDAQRILQQLQKGVSPEQIVREECKRRNIDVNQFLNSLSKR